MLAHPTRRAALIGTLGLGVVGAAPVRALPSPPIPAPVIEFISNPLADYLHLLFFRAKKTRFAAFDAPGFEAAPQLEYLLAVPELVAAAGLTDYAQVEPFVAETFAALPALRVSEPQPRILSYGSLPAPLDEVLAVIRAGAPFHDPFMTYWRHVVSPHVATQIEAWKAQDQAHRPLQRLTEMHRLPLRSNRFLLAAMPFHPAGSANYSPAGVYTSLFRTPDLGRVLGHEASHLLWSAAVGTDWTAHPLAASVKALAEPKEVDVEETMCLLMQTILSQACGVQPPEYRVSSDLEAGAQRELMTALEGGWSAYLADAARWPTLIDYVLETARTTLA